MRRHLRPHALFLVVILCSASHAAPDAGPSAAGEAVPPRAGEKVVPRNRTPMMAEIAAALADARGRVDDLGRRAKSAPPAEAVVMQREAERVKFEAELQVLRIQVSWAKREGRASVARTLEAAIEARLHPVPLGDPNAAPARRAEDR